MQSKHSSLRELTECSICLDTFTRPKMLPCGHTFCYSCLIGVAQETENDPTFVTCPHCRKLHDIPIGGVAAFSENLVLNNLLPILHNEKEGECVDCDSQLNQAVSKCDHCNEYFCADCLHKHNDTQSVIQKKLDDLCKSVQSKAGKRKLKRNKSYFKESIDKLMGEVITCTATFDAKRQELGNQQMFLENYFESVLKIYNDLLNATEDKTGEDSYLVQLGDKVPEMKKTAELNELLSKVLDFETVFQLAMEKRSPPTLLFCDQEVDLASIGKVKFANTALKVHGNYQYSDGRSTYTSKGQNQTDTQDEGQLEEAQGGLPQQYDDNDGDVCGSRRAPVLRQNQLPMNVDFATMGQRDVSIFGKSGCLRSQLNAPVGMAYHLGRRELYVASYGDNNVKVYDSERNGRIFYAETREGTGEHFSIAISDNGKYVYVLKAGILLQLSLAGKVLREVSFFPSGRLTQCRSVAIWNGMVAVLEGYHMSVIFFDENLRYVRHFKLGHVKYPNAMAVSKDGKFYIADSGQNSVDVFSEDGKPFCTFGRINQERTAGLVLGVLSSVDRSFFYQGDSAGVEVDGDGNVYVVRWRSDRIDVYNPQFELMASIGGPGKGRGCFYGPCRLLLTPDGRLFVSESHNHRVQSFE